MKIAVIGADGRSGRVFTEMALEAGHAVAAGVHSHNPFEAQPNLTVQECDATNLTQVTALLQDCDAVVSLIGHTKHSTSNVHTEAIETVITAMQTLGLKRIVSLTGTGVRMPRDKITLADRLSEIGIRIIDNARVVDGKNHADLLTKSGLDWTIIRVSKLQGSHLGKFSLLDNGPAKTPVSRQEVAKAILTILDSAEYIGRTPMIAKMPRGAQA